MATNLRESHNSFPQIILNFRRLKQLSEKKLGLYKIITVLGTSIEDNLDLIYDFTFDHEVVAVLGDATSFDHPLINDVYGRLTFILEIPYNELYLRPSDLLLKLVSIF